LKFRVRDRERGNQLNTGSIVAGFVNAFRT
jgi:hypothetical protein